MSTSTQAAPLVLGPYELVQRIATGGMAEVYLARREGPHGFQKRVAVKRILPQMACDADFVAMFIDEARVCARLTHPNIVQVFDFGEQDGELYMAMEYVDGTTGARLIRAAAAKGEALPLEVPLHIALSVLRALHAAHNARDENNKRLHLVHRDVSPGNVLIDRSGAVKLTDFGIARAVEIERRTDAGQLKGKLGYMSPEQVVGRELDARSDLFTVGIVLAELVTLRPLFAGGNEMDVLVRIRDADLSAIERSTHRVPDDIRAILYRALARDRAMRYASAAEFIDDIEEVVRRRRLQVGPARLAAWVDALGLVDRSPITGDSARTIASEAPGEVSTREMAAANLATSLPPPSASKSPPAEVVTPDIYRVQTGAGSMLGPMSYPRLIELFATGRINQEHLVSKEGSAFKAAKSYTELSRFVASQALYLDAEMPRGVVDRAPIDLARLPARFFSLAAKRETGAIVLYDGARRKRVYVVEGVPDFVASTDKAELLGEQLVARGQLLRMEVDMALAMLPRFRGKLGDALLGLGVLRPVELVRAVHAQMQSRFMEMLSWRSGEIAFLRGARSHEETLPLALDPFELVARGVRESYSSEELAAIVEPMFGATIAPVYPLPARLETFRFSDREEWVLKQVKREVVMGEFVEEATSALSVGATSPRDDILRALFLGLSAEIIQSPAFAPHGRVPR